MLWVRLTTSLAGKLAALLAAAALLGATLVAGLAHWLDDLYLAWLLGVLCALPLAAWAGAQTMQPFAALIRTLGGAVARFRDGDFSTSIHRNRDDELGDLISAYNDLGNVLRDERQHLFQRELLLDTVVQNTPTALLLEAQTGHVVYANLAARKLFGARGKLEGRIFAELLDGVPEAMRDATAGSDDCIFSVSIDGQDEAFHFSRRAFRLNGRGHRLHLFRRITRELSRQEVAVWKKVIRVISHELNNSLAPISSLAHSGAELAARGQTAALGKVFATIEERARHLDTFIRGYAAVTKLPAPRRQRTVWASFLETLAAQQPFAWEADAQASADIDSAQIGQTLINLVKNAQEAGSAAEDVRVVVTRIARQWRVEVHDRGSGMSETVMANALLPFYSTKRNGTGLGLALAREISEAHDGRITLSNRDGGGLSVTLWLPA
jgi:nitrogen fixation/metabolism regulation signal transduction histidine kinase